MLSPTPALTTAELRHLHEFLAHDEQARTQLLTALSVKEERATSE
jgi:hypothetical protein